MSIPGLRSSLGIKMGNIALKDKAPNKILADIQAETDENKRLTMMLRLIPEEVLQKDIVTFADLGTEMHLIILLKAIDEAIFKKEVNVSMLKALVKEIGNLSTKNVNVNIDVHHKMASKEVDNMGRDEISRKIGEHYRLLDEGSCPVAGIENADYKKVDK